MMTRLPSTPRRQGKLHFPGVVLLLFPLLSLGIAIAWLQNRAPELAAYPTAPGAAQEQEVATWIGSLAGVNGGELHVRLTRLHPQPGLQNFETQVLRKRFGEVDGEPWQLELVATPDWTGDLDLSELQVLSAGQVALRAVLGPAQPAPGEVVDPVRVLFSAPLLLRPGEAQRFVVWGEEPTTTVRLVLGAQTSVPLEVHVLPHADGPLVERTARRAGQQDGDSSAAGDAAHRRVK